MDLVGAWLCIDNKRPELSILFHTRAKEIEEELVDEFMGKEKDKVPGG